MYPLEFNKISYMIIVNRIRYERGIPGTITQQPAAQTIIDKRNVINFYTVVVKKLPCQVATLFCNLGFLSLIL